MSLPANRIVPAVLTERPVALATMLRQSSTFTDWVQVDIMDGRFVPSRSISSGDIAAAGVKIEWEAHLMVCDPEKYLEDLRAAGAKRIVVHYEAVLGGASDVIENITSMGMGAGLAVNPETPVSALKPGLMKRLDTVLFLSVHPGFYGAKFIPEVLDKIALFRQLYPEMTIGIDGGIKFSNVTAAARCGVNEICVGSAVFSQPDPGDSFRELTQLANQGWSEYRASVSV
jgi:ribulose-phosphate 3-epimerase